MFSDAISSISFCCRSYSFSIASQTSGSASSRCLVKKSIPRASARRASLAVMANCSSRSRPVSPREGLPDGLCTRAALPWTFGWLYHMSRTRASNAQGVGLKRHRNAAIAGNPTADCGSVGRGGRGGAVVAIDVRPEVHLAVGRRPGADIGEIDRNRLGELHVDLLPGLLHGGNTLVAPARRVTQDPRHQLLDIMHAHAARALEPDRFAEQALERRIVHVHRVLVGKVDLHEAEGVLVPGKLAEIVVVDLGAVPIDLARVERIAGSVEGLHVVGGEHVLTSAGERASLGNEVLVDDGTRVRQ